MDGGHEGAVENKFRCTVLQCRSAFSTAQELQKHVRGKHSKTQMGYHCPMCKETFQDLGYLKDHLQGQHSVSNEEWDTKYSGTPAVLCEQPVASSGEHISVTKTNRVSPESGKNRSSVVPVSQSPMLSIPSKQAHSNLITLGGNTNSKSMLKPKGPLPSVKVAEGYLCRFCPSKDDEIFQSINSLKQHEALVHDLGRRDIQVFLDKISKTYSAKNSSNPDVGSENDTIKQKALYWCRFCNTSEPQFLTCKDLECHELNVHRVKQTAIDELTHKESSSEGNKDVQNDSVEELAKEKSEISTVEICDVASSASSAFQPTDGNKIKHSENETGTTVTQNNGSESGAKLSNDSEPANNVEPVQEKKPENDDNNTDETADEPKSEGDSKNNTEQTNDAQAPKQTVQGELPTSSPAGEIQPDQKDVEHAPKLGEPEKIDQNTIHKGEPEQTGGGGDTVMLSEDNAKSDVIAPKEIKMVDEDKCWKCAQIITTREGMVDHMLSQHGSALPCRFCKEVTAVFQYAEELQKHEVDAHNLTEEVIRRFLWKLKANSSVSKHATHRGTLLVIDTVPELAYHCPFCNSVDSDFPYLDQLKVHESTIHHLSPEQITSLIDNAKFNRTRDLDNAKDETDLVSDSKITPKAVTLPTPKVAKPLVCSKHPQLPFASRPELKRHKKRDHVRNYSCNHCHSRFSKFGHLAHHELAIHDAATSHTLWISLMFGPSRKDFEVSESDSSYMSDSSEDEPLDEKPDQPIQCPHCSDKTFHSRLELRNHWRIFHRTNFNPCPSCTAAFQTWDLLKEHESVSHNRKKVDIIRAVAATYKNLKMLNIVLHMQDEQQKPDNPGYACPLCQEAFSCKSDILKSGHIGQHRDEFYCRFCNNCKFPEAGLRETHEEQSHLMNKEDVLRYASLANRMELDPKLVKVALTSSQTTERSALDKNDSEPPMDTRSMSEEQVKEPNETVSYQCPHCSVKCDEKLEGYFKLAEHKLIMHDDYSEYIDLPEEDYDSDSLHTWSDSDSLSESDISMSDFSMTSDSSWSEDEVDCPFCKKRKYAKPADLRQHYRSKHSDKYYPCPFCTTISSSWEGMLKHEKESHNRTERDMIRSFSTDLQHKQLKLLLDMQDENVKKKSQRKYHCPVCSFESSTKETVIKHLKKHDMSEWRCRFCVRRRYSQGQKQQRHEARSHYMSKHDVTLYVGIIEKNLLSKWGEGSRKRDRRDAADPTAAKKRRESKERKESDKGESSNKNSGEQSQREEGRHREESKEPKSSKKSRSSQDPKRKDSEDKESRHSEGENKKSVNPIKDGASGKETLKPKRFSFDEPGKYECTYCPDLIFTKKQELKNHYRTDHEITGELCWCKFCNSTLFPNAEFLEIHELVEHQVTRKEREQIVKSEKSTRKRSRSRSRGSSQPRKSRRESDSNTRDRSSNTRDRSRRSREKYSDKGSKTNDKSKTNKEKVRKSSDKKKESGDSVANKSGEQEIEDMLMSEEHGEWSVVDAVGSDDEGEMDTEIIEEKGEDKIIETEVTAKQKEEDLKSEEQAEISPGEKGSNLNEKPVEQEESEKLKIMDEKVEEKNKIEVTAKQRGENLKIEKPAEISQEEKGSNSNEKPVEQEESEKLKTIEGKREENTKIIETEVTAKLKQGDLKSEELAEISPEENGSNTKDKPVEQEESEKLKIIEGKGEEEKKILETELSAYPKQEDLKSEKLAESHSDKGSNSTEKPIEQEDSEKLESSETEEKGELVQECDSESNVCGSGTEAVKEEEIKKSEGDEMSNEKLDPLSLEKTSKEGQQSQICGDISENVARPSNENTSGSEVSQSFSTQQEREINQTESEVLQSIPLQGLTDSKAVDPNDMLKSDTCEENVADPEQTVPMATLASDQKQADKEDKEEEMASAGNTENTCPGKETPEESTFQPCEENLEEDLVEDNSSIVAVEVDDDHNDELEGDFEWSVVDSVQEDMEEGDRQMED